MKRTKTSESRYVNELREKILNGELGPKPEDLTVTGASHIYQTTQFTSSKNKYHNYYLLLRVEDYFGACSHTHEQVDMRVAAELSGISLDTVLQDKRLPVQIAGMDAYLGIVKPHKQSCTKVVDLPEGKPLEKAKRRDEFITDVTNIHPNEKVALVGVVNPLVEAIKERGGICLPCDLSLETTEAGQVVERDMEKVLDRADRVICTAMTLGNGTFDRVLTRVRERGIPLTVYAQTGSTVVAQFMNEGVSELVAEPFPFSQFSALTSRLYHYTTRKEVENGHASRSEY
ncbi:DUF364 domain-containing protein [Halalkalibacter sp. APA_J-10(15)]|uniref:Rossmann-like domain-containing protein n=1 Tax=Halalkalibacter sp. APA_J-10(15) TaxID=2933805 RepID=UPI001FF22B43|nr:DUF364 domain-containing protein [Halalkalibacter sp. APA_J-10(15)]MCK0473715.1 DUF364 domain-containing protein [Halalkalibacter sp. APA_J-10(15)]